MTANCKAALVLAATLIASNGAFAQTKPAQPVLAPGGASGLHAAQGFYPDSKTYVIAAVGLAVVGLLLTRLTYHNPADHNSSSPSTSGTN